MSLSIFLVISLLVVKTGLIKSIIDKSLKNIFLGITAEFEAFQAETKEKISLVMLRELFLRFRVAAREVVEPILTRPVRRVIEKYKGENLECNILNLNRELDYSFFLKQVMEDVESGSLDPRS